MQKKNFIEHVRNFYVIMLDRHYQGAAAISVLLFITFSSVIQWKSKH